MTGTLHTPPPSHHVFRPVGCYKVRTLVTVLPSFADCSSLLYGPMSYVVMKTLSSYSFIPPSSVFCSVFHHSSLSRKSDSYLSWMTYPHWIYTRKLFLCMTDMIALFLRSSLFFFFHQIFLLTASLYRLSTHTNSLCSSSFLPLLVRLLIFHTWLSWTTKVLAYTFLSTNYVWVNVQKIILWDNFTDLHLLIFYLFVTSLPSNSNRLLLK